MTTTAESFEGGVRKKVEDFVSGVKGQAERLKSRSAEDLWIGCRDYVRDNPGKTILVTLGIGVVIGSLLRRK